MNDNTKLLDRLFYSFVDLTDTRDFFNGLCDYIDYINSVDEFEKIGVGLLDKIKPIEEKIETLNSIAVEKLKQVHKELTDYISKNKINRADINKALQDYDLRIGGHIKGRKLADGLHDELSDIIRYLHETPEHKEFASKYILFWNDKIHIRHWLYPDEIKDFYDYWKEAQEQHESELWGQMGDVINYYKIIKEGRERRKELVREYENNSLDAVYELVFNHDILLGEWAEIQEGKCSNPIFFKIAKVKPIITRFQNYILTGLNKSMNENYRILANLNKDIDLNKESGGLDKALSDLSSYLAKSITKHRYNPKTATKKLEKESLGQSVSKITVIKLKSSKIAIAVNDNYQETKVIKDYSPSWQIFIKEIEDRNLKPETRKEVKEISKSMSDYFNYNSKKCPIYMGGKYALTDIFTGKGNDTIINPDVKTEIITEAKFISRREKQNNK